MNQNKMHLCFHNTLTNFELNVTADPHATLESIVAREVMKYNFNAFAYQYKTCGEIISLDRTIENLHEHGSSYPGSCLTIFMIFPDTP